VTDSTEPAHLDPRVEEFLAATERLTGPGAPFELVTDDVLGEPMKVFRNRPGSLREVLVGSAVHGDRLAMAFSDGREITFDQFHRQVASVAAYLRDTHGIGPGDNVALCGANGAGWILSFWATLSLGAVVVAMNGWWTQTEMVHAVELTEPSVLLIDAKRAERLDGTDLTMATVDLDADLDTMIAYDPAAAMSDTPIDEDDPAMLIFTSGTTGRAKAAVLTHRSIIAYSQLQNFIGARGMVLAGVGPSGGPPPVRLAVFPLFHVSGLGATVNSTMTGSTTVWPLGRFDAGTVIDLTIRYGINVWGGTGTHVVRLLEHPELERIPAGQLVSVGMGGSATTPDIIRRLDEGLPHLAGTMSSGYGSTETGALVSFAPNWMLAASPDCVGPPLPSVEVRVTGPTGEVLPHGAEGEIWVRSPLLMKGYWRNDAANAEVFTDGRWFNTGDFGRLEGGLLHLASRRRDLIIRGGENIYPFEIENRLDEHDHIVEAAVLGVDHDVLGQEVKAIVVVTAGSELTEDDVRDHCAETLSSYKVPTHVEIRTEPLPRNPSGKVLKNVLAGDATSDFVEE
jgi:acyl-CoA synthetase (AMP-forming)/AMP-acid ligase II